MKTKLLFPTLTMLFLVAISSYSQTVYKLDQLKTYDWNSAWEQQFTHNYTYANGGNKETNVVVLTYPEGDVVYQSNSTYNSNNDISINITQYWNDVTSQWENSYKEIYTYDGSNNLIEEVSQTYNPVSMTFVNSYRYLQTFSGSNLMSEVSQSWNAGSSSWVNVDKYDYTYSGNLPIQAINSVWDSGSNSWLPDERDTATYTGNLITSLDVDKYNVGIWEDYQRIFYTYNGQGLETEYLSQDWDGVNWVNLDRDTSTYNVNGNRTVLVYESWVASAWEPYYKEEASYSVAAPLSTEAFQNTHLKIFPNPASDLIHISTFALIDKIEMFDALGKNVLTTFGTKQIDVKNYKSGVYLLKVYSNNLTTSKKIVIK
ncbi:T9SS type A sorting domain-containing protein [Mariniflexile jejuense]|uniref:T9SS type A sorting domain-containing protein n=1 Tax=Mariniflexile jejuense TaxID=1173582 RepID=A0ABW3JEM1_9FLAO